MMKVKPITEHEAKPVQMEGAEQVRMRMLIGPEDGAPNFHMRHFEVGAGGNTPHHEHPYEHEVLILSGTGKVRSAEGDRPVTGGDVVLIPGGEQHQFVNTGGEVLTFLCLIPAPEDCCK